MGLSDRYLEDFAVGPTFGSGSQRIDEDRIKSFAAEFDPRSMRNLSLEARLRAIEIANALLEEGYEEGKAIRIAIAKAKDTGDGTPSVPRSVCELCGIALESTSGVVTS